MSAPNSQRTKHPKRGQVIMPKEPPFDILMWMAGDPLLLAASDQKIQREYYIALRDRLALRKDRT